MRVDSILFNALGIFGALLLLFGFYRITIGKWSGKSVWYEFDNALGTILIIVYQIHYHAYVTVVVNAVWAAVAVMGLAAFLRRVHGHRRRAKKARS